MPVKEEIIGLSKEGKDHYIIKSLKDSIYTLLKKKEGQFRISLDDPNRIINDEYIFIAKNSNIKTITMNTKGANHIAVSVPHLDNAVKWYSEVLGFTKLTEPSEIVADNSRLGLIVKDCFGPSIRKLRIAHLSFGDQVGLEIFEFVEPKVERPTNCSEYSKTSFLHIAVTSPNIEQLAKQIAESGGKQRSKIWKLIDGKPFKIVFCEDPFGNIIELYSHDFNQVWNATLI